MGDVEILLVQWRLSPSDALADQIFAGVAANVENPAREVMWGAPGTVLAALFMFRQVATNAGRKSTAEILNSSLTELEKNDDTTATSTADLWTVNILPLAPSRVTAANVFAILKGRKYLDSQTLKLVESRAKETTERSAKADAAYANSPAGLGGTASSYNTVGAPGMITCLADLPAGADEVFDQLLAKGGELIWRAGPPQKARTCVTAPPAMATPF